MPKPMTYALLLAAMLGLAACEKSPEDKADAAKASATEAVESMGDALEKSADAIGQKANELVGNEPTTDEKIEEAADQTADVIKQAGDEIKDTVDAQ